MDVVIWHNPRCSTSRRTLALLEGRGLTPTVRHYLDDPPTLEELQRVAAALGGARPLVRAKEAVFTELGLAGASDDALLAALAAHPRLIERPVVLVGDRAALGRPPEAALALVDPC